MVNRKKKHKKQFKKKFARILIFYCLNNNKIKNKVKIFISSNLSTILINKGKSVENNTKFDLFKRLYRYGC